MVGVVFSEKYYWCSVPISINIEVLYSKRNGIHRKTGTEYFSACTICSGKEKETQGKNPASTQSERDLNLDFTDTA